MFFNFPQFVILPNLSILSLASAVKSEGLIFTTGQAELPRPLIHSEERLKLETSVSESFNGTCGLKSSLISELAIAQRNQRPIN